MNAIQRCRLSLAEKGFEYTPSEVGRIMSTYSDLADMSYEKYLQWKSLDDDDIQRLATEDNSSFDEIKKLVDIAISLGKRIHEPNFMKD